MPHIEQLDATTLRSGWCFHTNNTLGGSGTTPSLCRATSNVYLFRSKTCGQRPPPDDCVLTSARALSRTPPRQAAPSEPHPKPNASSTMRTTFLFVALIALAACTGGASAQASGPGDLLQLARERRTARQDTARQQFNETATKLKTAGDAGLEAVRGRIDVAQENFKASMTAALKVGGRAWQRA